MKIKPAIKLTKALTLAERRAEMRRLAARPNLTLADYKRFIRCSQRVGAGA